MELDQNSDNGNLEPGYDIVSPNAIPDQEDARYFPKEETGKDLAFGYQWKGDAMPEFDPVTQAPDLGSNASAVYREAWIKSDNTTILIPEESEGASLVAWHGSRKPVSNLEEQMEESVKVKGLQNTNVKVLKIEDMREGFKIREIYVNEKTQNFQIPTYSNSEAFLDAESDQTFEDNGSLESNVFGTNKEKQKHATPVLNSFCNLTESNFRNPTYYNPEAFLDAESDQTSEYSESFEPNFFGTNEEKQKHATPVLDSFCNLTESDGKGSPDFDFEETSNTGDECQKVKVGLEELSLKAVEHTTVVQEGHICLKALYSMDRTCREKVGYMGDLGKAEKSSEDGAGEPASKETSKKKKKKNKTQKPNTAWKYTPNRTDTLNANPITYSCAPYMKSASENSYPKGIIPVSANFFDKNVHPANENYNTRGFRPASGHHSFGRGVRPVSGNSYGRGVKSSSEHSFANSFHPTSGNYYSRDVRPTGVHSFPKDICPANENSYPRGFKPTSEHSHPSCPASENSYGRGLRSTSDLPAKGFHPTSENSHSRGFHPRENSHSRGFHPTSENSYSRGFHTTSENSHSRGFHPRENSHSRGFHPTSENSHSRGFHPTSENSHSRGFHQTSENSHNRGFHQTSENSHSRGFHPTSENSSRDFHPTSENSHSRGFKPSNERSFPKSVHQTCDTSRTRVFRPTRENSFPKGFGPTSENMFVKDFHLASGNGSAKDNQPGSINLSGERKVSFSNISIAEREERALHPNTSQETKNISIRYCSSQAWALMPRLSRLNIPKSCDNFGASGPVPTAYPAGARKVAVVKPRPKEMEMFSRKVLGPPTESDFIEMVLATDNMFEPRSAERKTRPGYKKHTNSFLGEGCVQRGVSKDWPRKGRGQYSSDESFGGVKAGCRQWTQSTAERHPDSNRNSLEREESEEMEPPLQLKQVNWVGNEDIGHFFVSGLTTVDTAGHGESGCHSQPNFLTFDELVLLDGLETAIVSITDSIEMVVAEGFVARFPESCSLHLLVNEDDSVHPEYIIVCCSCPKLIIAHQVGAVKTCPKCRFVRLGTYPEMKIKCQFMLLRSPFMLRFVLLSSSLSICEWENRLLFGWFHDFSAVNETKPNCFVSSDQQQHPTFQKDLTEFLASLQIPDLNVLSGIDFSTVSPAVRLIHTKPGFSCTNDPSKHGAPQLQQIIKNLVWKSQKKKQSLYKTERLDQRGYSILNDVFPNALSGEFQTALKRVKVVYPSFRWVDECLANSASPERLKMLSTVGDMSSFEDLPWNFLHDLGENNDFVHNYNVLGQYENWEQGWKTKKKYGWFLTGSQALDTESWGDDYPVYHKVMYKHFQLSVGLFPYLRRNENSKEVEVCAVDLCDVHLPFDPAAVVQYHHDDMPRLVLASGQNVFSHCVGVFTRARSSFGFIKQSVLLKGLLEPFPASSAGQYRHEVFLHVSNLPQPELPPEGSVLEFFFLNQTPTHSHDFVKVCRIFSSIEEAKIHFLSEEVVHKEMVQAKALSLGLESIDNVQQMEDAIEDYYNVLFSSQRRGFSYFPTQQQIDAISIEPVKLLNDTEWVRDYYKNRRNHGGLPQDIGGCRPSVLLATFSAIKYRFVKELREVEEQNQKLEEENQGCTQKWDI